MRLDLFSFKGRMLRSDLILVYKILNGMCSVEPDEIFSPALHSITRGHEFKLFKPRVRLELRKRFFSNRVIDVWNSLSPETVSAGNINSFKSGLYKDLALKLYEFD